MGYCFSYWLFNSILLDDILTKEGQKATLGFKTNNFFFFAGFRHVLISFAEIYGLPVSFTIDSSTTSLETSEIMADSCVFFPTIETLAGMIFNFDQPLGRITVWF